LSPVEASGLENLNNVAIERYLEVGNYEDAFVTVRIIQWTYLFVNVQLKTNYNLHFYNPLN